MAENEAFTLEARSVPQRPAVRHRLTTTQKRPFYDIFAWRP